MGTMNELPDYYDYVSSTINDGREDEQREPRRDIYEGEEYDASEHGAQDGNDMSEYEGELIEDEGNTDEA